MKIPFGRCQKFAADNLTCAVELDRVIEAAPGTFDRCGATPAAERIALDDAAVAGLIVVLLVLKPTNELDDFGDLGP